MERYYDDEQRSEATLQSPARRVRAACGRLRRRASSLYLSIDTYRRRSLHSAARRSERNSRLLFG